MNHVQDLISHLKEANRLEAELKYHLGKIDELAASDGPIVSDWVRNGKKSETHADGTNLHLRTSLYCNKRKEVDQANMCDALKASGLSEMVSLGYSHQGLKAWVSETIKAREEDGEPVSDPMEVLPSALRGLLNVTRKTKVVVRGLDRPSVPKR